MNKFLILALSIFLITQPPIVKCMDTTVSSQDSTDNSTTGTSSGTYNDDGGVDKR